MPRPMPSLSSRQPFDRTVWHSERNGGPVVRWLGILEVQDLSCSILLWKLPKNCQMSPIEAVNASAATSSFRAECMERRKPLVAF